MAIVKGVPDELLGHDGTFAGKRVFKSIKAKLGGACHTDKHDVISFGGVKITMSLHLAPTQIVTDDPELALTLSSLEENNKKVVH